MTEYTYYYIRKSDNMIIDMELAYKLDPLRLSNEYVLYQKPTQAVDKTIGAWQIKYQNGGNAHPTIIVKASDINNAMIKFHNYVQKKLPKDAIVGKIHKIEKLGELYDE